MKARTRNSMVVAAALMVASVVAIPARAEMRAWSPADRTVTMRTVLQYTDGAWMVPVAVVLKSAEDWNRWNAEMVAAGNAVAAEPVPAGVDWNREALLVVAVGALRGECSAQLSNPRRLGLATDVDLSVSRPDGNAPYETHPAHVVALDRRQMRNVRLHSNRVVDGLGTTAMVYGAPKHGQLNAAMELDPAALAVSWGEVKDAYRY